MIGMTSKDAHFWDNERKKLREAFHDTRIYDSNRKELEFYLIVLANTIQGSNYNTEQRNHEAETQAFSNVVEHLLSVRMTEEVSKKSRAISWLALILSIISLLISLFR